MLLLNENWSKAIYSTRITLGRPCSIELCFAANVITLIATYWNGFLLLLANSVFDSEEHLKKSDSELNNANLSQRLRGLVQAITGTIEETGQLLIHASSDSDNEKEQLTVRKKQTSDVRPSLFDMVSLPQRALSDPNVNIPIPEEDLQAWNFELSYNFFEFD